MLMAALLGMTHLVKKQLPPLDILFTCGLSCMSLPSVHPHVLDSESQLCLSFLQVFLSGFSVSDVADKLTATVL